MPQKGAMPRLVPGLRCPAALSWCLLRGCLKLILLWQPPPGSQLESSLWFIWISLALFEPR